MDDKAQISAELLIIMALVAAAAAVLAKSLFDTASASSDQVGTSSKAVLGDAEKILKSNRV